VIQPGPDGILDYPGIPASCRINRMAAENSWSHPRGGARVPPMRSRALPRAFMTLKSGRRPLINRVSGKPPFVRRAECAELLTALVTPSLVRCFPPR